MGLMFSAVFQGVAETAQQDQFEAQPGDDKPISVVSTIVTQETEFGDAQEEQIRHDIVRGNTTSGSGGGTNPTLRPHDRDNTVTAGTTVEINNTTKGTAGTTHIVHTENMNVRTGWFYIPNPEDRKNASQGDTTIAIGRTGNTPADSITMDGVLNIAEGV